jgi:hypothetical protein
MTLLTLGEPYSEGVQSPSVRKVWGWGKAMLWRRQIAAASPERRRHLRDGKSLLMDAERLALGKDWFRHTRFTRDNTVQNVAR